MNNRQKAEQKIKRENDTERAFIYDKSLGQNFIYDRNLLEAIVSDAGITAEDTVVEVGSGAGTLTAAIAAKAKKVISFEVDRRLFGFLTELAQEKKNIEFVFDDILKTLPEELAALTGGGFKVVANLPYYITTPVMFYFIEGGFDLGGMTLTVQKEVAEKVTAKAGEANYGVLSVMTALAGSAKITRMVPRSCFKPIPNVDSAVLRIDIKRGYEPDPSLRSLIKKSFAARRKTLANNLRAGYGLDRGQAEELVMTVKGDERVRPQQMTCEDFIRLNELLREKS